LVGRLESKNHLEDLSVDGKLKIEWISGKYGEKMWFGSEPGQGPVAGSCQHRNEPSGSIEGCEFLHLLSD